MEDSQTTVNTIYQEEYNIRNILSHQHQTTQRKQNDERNADAPHIPREALRVPLHHHQHRPHNHGQRENHASPAKHDGRVRRPLVGADKNSLFAADLNPSQPTHEARA